MPQSPTIPRVWRGLACLWVLVPGLALAEAPETGVEQILACMQRTRPLTHTVRTLTFARRDRVGQESITKARVYGGLSREGYRTLLVQVTEPEDLRDLTLLIQEAEGANHMFVSPAGLPQVRQVRGAPGEGRLFGSDFTYEDFQRLYGLARPGESRALDTGTHGDRPIWVVETRPAAGGLSAYQRIVSHVDRETCVLLRAEMFGATAEPVKVLEADPSRVAREGSTWVAHDVLLRDLREGTETRLVVDEIRLEVEFDNVPFGPEELEAANLERAERRKNEEGATE